MKQSIWQGCMPTGMTLEQRFELAALAGFEGVMLSVADEPAVEVAIPFKPSAAELKQLQSLAEQYVPITDIWCVLRCEQRFCLHLPLALDRRDGRAHPENSHQRRSCGTRI